MVGYRLEGVIECEGKAHNDRPVKGGGKGGTVDMN